MLSRRKISLDGVLLIEVPQEHLVERIVNRRMDEATGRIYHLKYDPPPEGLVVVQRPDDKEETVAKRLTAYEAMTSALIPYYRERGLLRSVNGVGSPAEVTERILGVLGVGNGGGGSE